MDTNQILIDFFTKQKKIDQSFSLRKYAKKINVSASFLSQILNGKKKLTYNIAKKMRKDLKLSTKQEKIFIAKIKAQSGKGVFKKDAQRILEKENLLSKSINPNKNPELISWQAFAILELTYLDNFNFTPQNISTVLNISEEKVKTLLNKLLKEKILLQKDSKYICNENITFTEADIDSSAIKQNLHQLLHKASNALVSQALDEREFYSIIMSLAKKDLPAFKKKLRNFQFEVINEFGNNDEKKDTVYSFQVQLFKIH